LVNSVIKIDYKNAGEEEHYFKVILENVRNKDLLDRKNIENYLSMTAPLPFPNHFVFKNKINSELQKDGLSIDEYNIFLNTDRLFKSYTTVIYEGTEFSKKKIDEIFDIEFIKIFKEKELLAWGWYGVSKFEKQIPARPNPARGLRLRKGNIQIGSENTLIKLHKEQRGNFYFVGEVHGFHTGLIPNARRDYFKENEVSIKFEKELSELFYTKFYKLYHDANRIKNACKKIVKPIEIEKDYKEKTKNGFSTKEEKEHLEENFLKCKEEAKKSGKELERIKERGKADEVLGKVYERILDNYNVYSENKDILAAGSTKTFYRTDKLSKLTKNERKLLSKVFSVIDLVLTPDLAENLKQKIEGEFK
jgi:molecular chaperone HtpG